MIRMRRYTIGGLMWLTLVISLGFAALRNASETWASVTFMVTCGVLALAIVGLICRPAAERGWWLGFSLFGGGYLWLSSGKVPGFALPSLPTSQVLYAIAPFFWPSPRSPKFFDRDFFLQVGHGLWGLLFAGLGGALGLALSGLFRARTEAPIPTLAPPDRGAPSRWRRPAALAFGGAVALVIATLAGYKRAPELLSASLYVLTCAFVGLAILGSVLGRRALRAEWLGLALFGGGYLVLHYGNVPGGPSWTPHEPANYVLNALRPWLASGVRVLHGYSAVKAAENERILRLLERPTPMKFPDETPLEDVLKYIKSATQGPHDDGIPIYIDPVGLQEAQKTMTSPIAIELEDVPLKTSLRLALKQLGLRYYVQDGMLTITSEPYDGYDPEDPYFVVGHCLLAWLAAGLGGVLAPLVAERRG